MGTTTPVTKPEASESTEALDTKRVAGTLRQVGSGISWSIR